MKKLLSMVLAVIMLAACAMPVFAEEAAGLTLAEGSHLKLDSEKMYIDKIDGTITVGDLKANFAGDVDVAGKADDAFVATDDVIGGYKALIYGDVNRDGNINLTDATAMLKKVAGWTIDINEDAADVDKTAAVNLADVSKLLKKVAGWDDISLGNVRMIFENTKLTAENEDSTLKLSFTSIMNKIGAHEIKETKEYSYKIKTAKNEEESCQVLLWSDTAKEGMTAELTPFVSEYGDAELDAKLQWIVYAPNYSVATKVNADKFNLKEFNDTVYTDDMVEVVLDMADTFELKENRLQHFVITTETTKDTPAGMYKAQFIVRDAEGKEVKKADVYTYVWDFVVPDAPYSASLFCGDGRNNVENYDFLLNYNLSSYVLPYEITDPRADAYMDDPRVTAFVIAGGGTGNGSGRPGMYGGLMDKTDEQTIANYEKVAANPEWFNKGMFYYTDEPYTEGLFQVQYAYEYVTELLGTTNIRNMTPFGQSYPNGELQAQAIDSVEFLKPYINVWVPTSDAYHRAAEGGKWTPRYIMNKRGEYPDRIEEMRERGDTIWWYVCCAPMVPYANYFTCYQGVIVRLLSWQQYFNNVDGVLYYQTIGGTITKYKFDISNGDGILSYNANLWGREGYAASWRLLQVRDGFDDFDYLKLAEEACGRDAVMEVVKQVSTGILKYTEDYNVLEACRDELVKMILEAEAAK